jgi:hypothetical protein
LRSVVTNVTEEERGRRTGRRSRRDLLSESGRSGKLRCALRPVVKDQKLVGLKCQLRVRLALVIGELNLIGAVQEFHDGADLAAQKAAFGDVCEERDDIQQLWCGVHCLSPLVVAQQRVNRFLGQPGLARFAGDVVPECEKCSD